MDAHNLLFWASGVLGVAAVTTVVIGKLTARRPAPPEHPVSDLPADSE